MHGIRKRNGGMMERFFLFFIAAIFTMWPLALCYLKPVQTLPGNILQGADISRTCACVLDPRKNAHPAP